MNKKKQGSNTLKFLKILRYLAILIPFSLKANECRNSNWAEKIKNAFENGQTLLSVDDLLGKWEAQLSYTSRPFNIWSKNHLDCHPPFIPSMNFEKIYFPPFKKLLKHEHYYQDYKDLEDFFNITYYGPLLRNSNPNDQLRIRALKEKRNFSYECRSKKIASEKNFVLLCQIFRGQGRVQTSCYGPQNSEDCQKILE